MPRRSPPPMRHPGLRFGNTCLGLLYAAALLLAAPAQASEAVIVEVYQDCRLIDTNVVIDDRALSGADSGEVKARVAAATLDPQMAVPRIVQILKEYGINDVSVSQQGLAGCEPETSGKFVEAVGRYCGPVLRHAEVFVDRQSFISSDRPGTSFEAFLKKAVKQLRDAGIYDRPMVSIENAPDCEQDD
ncbi:MAG: hypothetical protein U5R46_19945 [Gammaproteobacteria bacterium]|nr:hypothetical protein [Gammaproteobacteria bacterium]